MFSRLRLVPKGRRQQATTNGMESRTRELERLPDDPGRFGVITDFTVEGRGEGIEGALGGHLGGVKKVRRAPAWPNTSIGFAFACARECNASTGQRRGRGLGPRDFNGNFFARSRRR